MSASTRVIMCVPPGDGELVAFTARSLVDEPGRVALNEEAVIVTALTRLTKTEYETRSEAVKRWRQKRSREQS
jgi:hypothetical protein